MMRHKLVFLESYFSYNLLSLTANNPKKRNIALFTTWQFINHLKCEFNELQILCANSFRPLLSSRLQINMKTSFDVAPGSAFKSLTP